MHSLIHLLFLCMSKVIPSKPLGHAVLSGGAANHTMTGSSQTTPQKPSSGGEGDMADICWWGGQHKSPTVPKIWSHTPHIKGLEGVANVCRGSWKGLEKLPWMAGNPWGVCCRRRHSPRPCRGAKGKLHLCETLTDTPLLSSLFSFLFFQFYSVGFSLTYPLSYTQACYTNPLSLLPDVLGVGGQCALSAHTHTHTRSVSGQGSVPVQECGDDKL